MTVQIDTTKALILIFGCLVMYFVFKYTRHSHPGPIRAGDLVGSITAGATVIAVLAFLMGPEAKTPDDVPAPAPTSSPLNDCSTHGPSPTSTGPASRAYGKIGDDLARDMDHRCC